MLDHDGPATVALEPGDDGKKGICKATGTIVCDPNDATKKTTKAAAKDTEKAADKTVDTSKKVANKTVEGVKKTGNAIKKVINP